MPPIIAAFFILTGLGAGSALVGPPSLWDGVDPTKRFKPGKPAAFDPYIRVETGAATSLYLHPDRCDVTVLVVAGRTMRVRVNGQEQLLDSAWTIPAVVVEGDRRRWEAEFLEPVGGRVVATRQAQFACYPRRKR